MFNKMKNKLHSRKGFTLVELIVVIVIMLILGAALVPQVMKYVGEASKSTCQQEAATALTEAQARFGEAVADSIRTGSTIAYPTFTLGNGVKIDKKTPSTSSVVSGDVASGTSGMRCGKYQTGTVDGVETITSFGYFNGQYYVVWNGSTWEKVGKK